MAISSGITCRCQCQCECDRLGRFEWRIQIDRSGRSGLVAGENESPSRIWTTTNSLVPFAITMIRISWRWFTANAMRTSSTLMVCINWINLNYPNHLTRNINKKWCVHHTRRISNGVHSARPQRHHRLFTCRIIITIPPLRWPQLRLLTATTGIIPVPTIMRRISPLRIHISRHPIGSVQPQVQHRQAPVDCQRQAQHRRLSHHHYPIEREKESRDNQSPIVLLYTNSFSFVLSFFLQWIKKMSTDTLWLAHCRHWSSTRHLERQNICMAERDSSFHWRSWCTARRRGRRSHFTIDVFLSLVFKYAHR